MSAASKMVHGLAASVCAGALLGCPQGQSPYTPQEAKACAVEQARYFDELVEACYDRYELDECPAVPGIKAAHRARQEAAGCR